MRFTSSGWQYEQVGSDDPAFAASRSKRGTLVVSKVHWAGPVVLFLASCFGQNVVLSVTTRDYIRRMDELSWRSTVVSKPSAGTGPGANVTQSVVSAEEPSKIPMSRLFLELVTGFVPVIWMGWAVRTCDFGSWVRTLTCAALLVALKGLLAWATVVPEPGGWTTCQIRLGADGLSYYRELAAGRSVGPLGALIDTAYLTLRGVFTMGYPARHCFCGDTMFSTSVCLNVLFSMSLYEAVQSSTQWLAEPRDRKVRRATGAVLFIVVAANMVLAIGGEYHYVADVVSALILALLVYSNPAVALMVEKWMAVAAQDTVVPNAPIVPESPDGAQALADTAEAVTVEVPPYCAPCCSFGGQYRLSKVPLRTPHHMEPQEDAVRQQRQHLAEMGRTGQDIARHERNLQEAIDRESAALRQREEERSASVDERVAELVAEEKRKLDAQMQQLLDEAEQRLALERRRSVKLEEVVAEEQKHQSAKEAAFSTLREQLLTEISDAREARAAAAAAPAAAR